METNKNDLIIGINDKVSLGKSIFLGLQHVLSMDLYIMPIILSGMIGLSTGDTAFFIQMSFFACGIATIIQTGLGIKLPVVQGPSYVPLGALAAIGAKFGLGTMIGSLIPGAIVVILLGYFKVFAKVVQKIVPTYIGGLVVLIVGISITPTAINGVISTQGNLNANMASGFTAAAVLIICMVLSYKSKKIGGMVRLISVILALVSGTIVAGLFGQVDFTAVRDASWFQFPQLFYLGIPKFDFGSCILMIFVYMAVLLDTMGTWVTVSSVTGEELNDERLNKAAMGEGAGCLIGSLFGGTPLTGYSSNVGIIAITKVGSRKVIITSGVILMVLGMVPKFMSIIACIPTSVVNGVFAIVCIILISNGIKIIQKEILTERTSLVVGISVLVTVGTLIMPSDIINMLPTVLTYFVSSATAVGATTAVILNLLLPKENKFKVEKEALKA